MVKFQQLLKFLWHDHPQGVWSLNDQLDLAHLLAFGYERVDQLPSVHIAPYPCHWHVVPLMKILLNYTVKVLWLIKNKTVFPTTSQSNSLPSCICYPTLCGTKKQTGGRSNFEVQGWCWSCPCPWPGIIALTPNSSKHRRSWASARGWLPVQMS